MNSSVKTLIVTAAVSGLFGGTSARLNAQPVTQPNGQATVTAALIHHDDRAPRTPCGSQQLMVPPRSRAAFFWRTAIGTSAPQVLLESQGVYA